MNEWRKGAAFLGQGLVDSVEWECATGCESVYVVRVCVNIRECRATTNLTAN